MRKQINILLVEDNEGDVRIIRELLKEQTLKDFQITISGSLKATVQQLTENKYDAVLLDLGLPDSTGIETFHSLNKSVTNLPTIIILTGLNDSETGLLAVNKGAQDYLLKGQIDSEKLVKSIIYACERSRLKTELLHQLEATKSAENNALKLNRLLLILSNVNQSIVRIHNKNDLIDNVCESLVKTGKFLKVLTVFDYSFDNYSKSFTPEGKTDLKPEDQIFVIKYNNDIAKRAKPLIFNNLTGKNLKNKTSIPVDAKSFAMFPVGKKERIKGTFTLFSQIENFFDFEEINLLTEIIYNIDFAFSNIEKENEKKLAEDELRFTKRAAESLYSLSQKTNLPEKELITLALEMAVDITNSEIGYLHFVNDDQVSLDLFAWSEGAMKNCIALKDCHYPLSKAGIWADCARIGKPVIHNDYVNYTLKKGMPEGHAPVARHMSIPVSDDNKIVLIAGVGNKSDPYTESDSRHLLLLMNEMWKIIMRNRMIRELDNSREKLNLIANRTNAVMYQTDITGSNFIYVHEAIESLTGFSIPEIKETGLLKIIRKAERTGGENIEADSLSAIVLKKAEREYNMEYLIETKNGDLKWINDKSYPLTDEKGNTQGSIGILMDISSQKEAEIDLISQKNRSEQLFSNSPVAIVQLDSSGNILNANSSFENIFGFSRPDVIGENLDKLIVPEELKVEADNFYKETINGLAINEVSIRKRKNGSIIYVTVAGVPIKIKGEISGFYAMYSDITKQKIAEEALIKARDKAEESDRLKTAFLHNISHEIRTPMNAIVGFSALLSQPNIDDETSKSFIETIVQSSNHLLTIINDIVEISNIEARLIKITREEVDLNKMIKSISEIFQLKVREKNKTLKIFAKVPDNGLNVLTDNTKLYQILTNLVNNGIKFTPSGKIEIGYKGIDKYVEFFVSDTGIGIAEEFQTRIFDRFYQVEYSENRQYEGTGLGLSICKAYVELLGGEIRVISEPGKGSEFRIKLPFDKITSSVKEIITPQTMEIKVKGRKKILVAEDIDSNYKLIKFYLSAVDAEIILAKNGKEAVEYFKENSDVDLVLMDIKMPVMDGYTAVKLIREINKTVPIIAQTAYADDQTKAEESGCNSFISKPFQKQQLLTAIQEYLQV